MLGRVLVLSASAGAGHLRAAEAIEKAIRLRGIATQVEHVDVLKYTNKVFRHFYSKAYLDLVNSASRDPRMDLRPPGRPGPEGSDAPGV